MQDKAIVGNLKKSRDAKPPHQVSFWRKNLCVKTVFATALHLSFNSEDSYFR